MRVLASVCCRYRNGDIVVYTHRHVKDVHSLMVVGDANAEYTLTVKPSLHGIILDKLGWYAYTLLSLTLGVLCLLHRIIEIRVKYQPYFRYFYSFFKFKAHRFAIL